MILFLKEFLLYRNRKWIAWLLQNMELLWSHVFSNWISSGLGGLTLSLELPQFLQWTCRTRHCPYLSWCFHTTYGPCWAFSTWWKVKVKVAQSCLTLCDPIGYTYSPWNSPGQNTRVGSLSILQGIYPTQGSNPGLWHCRRILYQLSHQGSPVPPLVLTLNSTDFILLLLRDW